VHAFAAVVLVHAGIEQLSKFTNIVEFCRVSCGILDKWNSRKI
jgi:hypothetical protein